MRFVLNIGFNVTGDLGSGGGPQIFVITAEIIDTRGRPPEAKRSSVLAQFFSTVKIIRLEEGLGAFKFLIGVVSGLVELIDLGIERLDRSLGLFRGSKKDGLDRPDISLRVVANIGPCRQARIYQGTLKAGVRLADNEGKYVCRIGRGVVFPDRRPMPAHLDEHALDRLENDPALAFGQRGMLHQRELLKGIRRPLPIAE